MSLLSEADILGLETQANLIRQSVITMLAEAGSGHLAGSLGMADVYAAFYFALLRHDPRNPTWDNRDRLIVSNGHTVPVQYAALAHAGYFSLDTLLSLRKFGSLLQGHPDRIRTPGIETTSGPLGEGLAQAAGIALGARMDNKTFQTYCILSDGEHQCGSLWEAVQFVGKEKLCNLITVVDRNTIQISGNTEDIMPLEPLYDKYEAFGWRVLVVDGHNIEMFCDAIDEAKGECERPTVLLATTVPGKGVVSIEGNYAWHGKVPSKEEAVQWVSALQDAMKC